MLGTYDKNIVSVVQRLMSGMLDFAVNGLEIGIEEFYNAFLISDFPRRIERGDSKTVMGMSGIELAYAISGREPIPNNEMDVSQFCDNMREAYFVLHPMTNLQTRRKETGISQKMLADMSGIPLKTIQQYEQRRKDINRANVDYVLSMARVMNCDIEMLLEKV